MVNFSYEITEELGVLSTRDTWTCELNKVSWGGRAPTYDLRKWTDDHGKMSKGISLTEAEIRKLYEILGEILEG